MTAAVGRAVAFQWRLAAIYLVIGAVEVASGLESAGSLIGLTAGALITSGSITLIIRNARERKTNGRHRKAVEAHRVGADRGASDSPRGSSRGGTFGAGASMSARKKQDRIVGTTNNFYAAKQSALDAMIKGEMIRTGAAVGANQPTPTPQRAAGEFDGKQVDFVAGVVTGTRSFDVDKLGRLTGVAYKSVWRPGENQAECLTRDDMYTFFATFGGNGSATPSRGVREAKKDGHSLAECAHGFYGYYEGSNDYYETGRVMAVVEGYGETIVGSRGFRSEKARIVAIHMPADIKAGIGRLVARNYPDVPVFDSFDAMIAEFPPDDAGHGITPANDPDFWTRRA